MSAKKCKKERERNELIIAPRVRTCTRIVDMDTHMVAGGSIDLPWEA